MDFTKGDLAKSNQSGFSMSYDPLYLVKIF